MNRTLPNYQYGGAQPRNFVHNHRCAHNQQAQLIPERLTEGCGSTTTTNGIKHVEMEHVPMAPSTVKHLYSKEPLNYEQRFQSRPKGTLYDNQFTETFPTGIGKRKVLGGGHYKVYPLTNRHVIESRDYTSYSFPRPVWNTERKPELITFHNHVRTKL